MASLPAPQSPEAALAEFVSWPLPRLREWIGEWGPAAPTGVQRAVRLLKDGLAAHLPVPTVLDAAVARLEADESPEERRLAILTVLAARSYLRRWLVMPFHARAVAACPA